MRRCLDRLEAGLVLLVALLGPSRAASGGTLTYYADRSSFQSASSLLLQESFDEGDVDAQGFEGCSDPFHQNTTDNCWSAGDIAPRLAIASSSGSGTLIVGADALGFGAIVVGAGLPEDSTGLVFEGDVTTAVGFDLHALEDGVSVDVAVYGPGPVLLGSTSVLATGAGTFFGVGSPTPIATILLTAEQDGHELVGNVEFGPANDAELGIVKTGVESPLGTVVYTLVVTNHGPLAATGVVATDALPGELAYVSDDCGGVAGSPWTWTIGALAAHASATCHLTADVVTPGFLANTAEVSGEEPDPRPFNDSSTVTLPLGLITVYDDAKAFALAAPDLAVEDFEEGDVEPDSQTACSDPFGAATSDDCWQPGDIVEGFFVGTESGEGTRIFGPGTFTDSVSVGPLEFNTPMVLSFASSPHAVGFDLVAGDDDEEMTIQVYGSGGVELAETSVVTGLDGTFFGLVGVEGIESIVVTSTTFVGPIVDNVRFGLYVDADLEIDQSAVESPPGTVVLTLTATNHGPADASGVIVSDPIPSRLAFVSDDCGGTGGAPWTWSIGALASGTDAVCNLVLAVETPGGVVNEATIVGESPDPNATNDRSRIGFAVIGVGPETPAEGFALFRSFPDVTIPDETGAPFSFRDHADKAILVQVCSAWCTPCQQWTIAGAALQAALEAEIGAENFLLVDLLVQDSHGLPSEQEDAANWKDAFEFPGIVLHAEGSSASTLSALYDDLAIQYIATPGATFSIPSFFVLAPDCDNQIAVRGTPGSAQLGEEREIDTLSIDEMAALVAEVWQDRSCLRPYVHKLDRCAAGAAPVLASSESSDHAEAAESFTVPAGREFELGAVTAVAHAGAGEVRIYQDDTGAPGAAVCTTTAAAPSSVYAPNVRRYELAERCRLLPGDYWVGFTAEGDPLAPQEEWLGGLLPRDAPFAYRDALDLFETGCTDWSSAESCFGAEAAATELCFVLEPPVGSIFLEGFEGGGTAGWSATVGGTP